MACITPFTKRDIHKGWQTFPCGKCPPCLQRRASGWSYRLVTEGKRALSAHFVTLTYNDENLPRTRSNFKTLFKRDLQLYFKRLRKQAPTDLPIKYYAVGEYGSKNWRPHYHVILFNAEHNSIVSCWSNDRGAIGTVDIGSVTGASIGYVLKYMSKPARIPCHAKDDRIPEFSLMSKGLGSNHLTEKMIKWHKADLINRMYIPVEAGKKIAMPRYYKDKIYTEEERSRIAFFAKMDNEEAELKAEQKMSEQYGEDWVSFRTEQHHEAFRRASKDYLKHRKNIINGDHLQNSIHSAELPIRCGGSQFNIIDSAGQGYDTGRNDNTLLTGLTCDNGATRTLL